jgi:hypothetical protein
VAGSGECGDERPGFGATELGSYGKLLLHIFLAPAI